MSESLLHILYASYKCIALSEVRVMCEVDDILVCVCSALDYDFLPDHKYEFSVMATDGGSPPLSGSAMVQVINASLFIFFCNFCLDCIHTTCIAWGSAV